MLPLFFLQIDDNSLNSYLLSSSSDSLVQLSLNYCPISGKAFQEIKSKFIVLVKMYSMY